MFYLYNWINYSGIAALICLIATVLIVIFEAPFQLHKILGGISVLFAVIHAALIFVKYRKTHKKK